MAIVDIAKLFAQGREPAGSTIGVLSISGGSGVVFADAAVRGGLISLEEACERYTRTVDEYLSWQRSIDKHGLPGLRATRIQEYRGG